MRKKLGLGVSLAAVAVTAVVASPAFDPTGGYRLAGSDPVRGPFGGNARILTGDRDGWRVSIERAYAAGGSSRVTASARVWPGGLLLETAATGASRADRAVFERLADGSWRGHWSSGIDETLCSEKPAPFLYVGHRGAPNDAPENTLEAIATAVQQGANAIESDYCVTRDGQIATWHDRSPNSSIALARQSGLEGLPFRSWNPGLFTKWRRPVDELTLAELRDHYGYQGYSRASNGKLVWGRLNVQIPRIQDVLRVLALSPSIERLCVDVKIEKGDVAHARTLGAVIRNAFLTDELLRAAHVSERLVFLNVDRTVLFAIRDAFGSIPGAKRAPAYSIDFDIDVKGSPANEALLFGSDFASLGWATRSKGNFLDLVRPTVAARRSGQVPLNRVMAWTLNKSDEWKAAVDAGCDGICTDKVPALRAWREGRPGATAPCYAPIPPANGRYVPVQQTTPASVVGSVVKSIARFWNSIFG